MQTPVVVRKITPQSTPPSAAASNSRPIMQHRIQNAASMYVSNQPVLNQPRQQLTLTQNTQQPRTIVVSFGTPLIYQNYLLSYSVSYMNVDLPLLDTFLQLCVFKNNRPTAVILLDF